MGSRTAKSHRVGVTVPIRDRGCDLPVPGPCRVTRGYFPPPDEALALGWTPAQIMADCRRMTKDDLTAKLERQLLAAGLTPVQIRELYKLSRARLEQLKLAAVTAREEIDDEMGKPISFAKGIAIGMPGREALEKCLPSTPKEITKEILQDCVDAGLSSAEIARGFGTSINYLYNIASKKQFKWPRNARTEKGPAETEQAPAPQSEPAPLAADISPEPAEPPAIEPPHAPTSEELAELMKPAPVAEPEPQPEPEPVEEWAFTFGDGHTEQYPELTVYSDGRVMIRRVPLPDNDCYIFRLNADLTRCRIELTKHQGIKVRWRGREGIEGRVRAMANKLRESGLSFPVKFGINPATLTGERIGQ